MATTQQILGEMLCENPNVLVPLFQNEAKTALNAPNWKSEGQTTQVRIESARVSGALAPTQLRVMRAVGEIGLNSEALFAFLTSPAGFAVLDPVSRKSDHQKPVLQRYPWKEGSRLELASASIVFPMFTREFLVLNLIDQEQKLFVSKSVSHPDFPAQSQNKRALNTFAVRVVALDEQHSRLEILNYMNMAFSGTELAPILNYSNRLFLRKLYQQIGPAFQAFQAQNEEKK